MQILDLSKRNRTRSQDLALGPRALQLVPYAPYPMMRDPSLLYKSVPICSRLMLCSTSLESLDTVVEKEVDEDCINLGGRVMVKNFSADELDGVDACALVDGDGMSADSNEDFKKCK